MYCGCPPQFHENGPFIRALEADSAFTVRLIHTGQHYDHALSQSFFETLNIRAPDVNLNVGSGSHAEQTAAIMVAYEKELQAHPADRLVVVGDVNSTLACSLVAVKCNVPTAHVEAGLRSGDWSMPEEINRLVTDRLSDLHLVSDPAGLKHLKEEGVAAASIHFVGNLMIDTLYDQISKLPDLNCHATENKSKTWVLTLHRPGLVDHKERLEAVLDVIGENASACGALVHFPCHPRTKERLMSYKLWDKYDRANWLSLGPPLDYREFLDCWRKASIVLTDSGGLQEETTALGIPCLTLRPSTERPITISEGTNHLVGRDPQKINATLKNLHQTKTTTTKKPKYWDGQTASRIVAILKKAQDLRPKK